ncbi:cubilin-like [Branchiostoma floridae]|uniref:Cubilin-like n=1 Tax=Branchiostoma floridae TaxID=7739 RepID=A0A9J7KTP5_BRAFL|nr:cubilin-like [Branchiostoma floridae]
MASSLPWIGQALFGADEVFCRRGICTEEGFGDSGCNSFRNLLSNCGHVQTAGFPHTPYRNDIVCEWHLHVQPRHHIVLMFEHFELEESGISCEYDKLVVYDGVNEKAEMLGTFCGTHAFLRIVSSRNHLFMRFTSDTSLTMAGFYASYTSEVIRYADRQTFGAVVDRGPGTFPCPGSTNITGEELSAAAYTVGCELRERIVLVWEPWGNISQSLMQIYESDFDTSNPVVMEDFSRDINRKFVSKGHRLLLSLHLRQKHAGLFIHCRIEDIADKISTCPTAVRQTPDIGIIAMDNQISDTDLHCKVVVKTSTSLRLLTSLDLVSNPSASAQREPHGSRTRVDLYNPETRLLSLSSHMTSLPFPTVTSQDELLIVFWSNVVNSQWIPEVQYSPTGRASLLRYELHYSDEVN